MVKFCPCMVNVWTSRINEFSEMSHTSSLWKGRLIHAYATTTMMSSFPCAVFFELNNKQDNYWYSGWHSFRYGDSVPIFAYLTWPIGSSFRSLAVRFAVWHFFVDDLALHSKADVIHHWSGDINQSLKMNGPHWWHNIMTSPTDWSVTQQQRPD